MVTSPNHPGNYNPNEQCAWEIRGDDGSTININFEVGLESIFDCVFPSGLGKILLKCIYDFDFEKKIALNSDSCLLFRGLRHRGRVAVRHHQRRQRLRRIARRLIHRDIEPVANQRHRQRRRHRLGNRRFKRYFSSDYDGTVVRKMPNTRNKSFWDI